MKKILIVEDDFASELMLEMMIEDYCKFPLIAIDGLEAVRICKENPDIDLHLLQRRKGLSQLFKKCSTPDINYYGNFLMLAFNLFN